VTDTQARLAASKDVAEQVLDGTLPYEEAWHTLATDVLSLAAELERVTAALRQVADDWTHRTPGVNPDGSVSTSTMAQCIARAALAGAARAAQDDK
jgi:hypothetical protein